MKKKVILLIILSIVGASLLWWLTRRHEFLYAGTLEATEVDISSRLTSLISSYEVKEGDGVRAGQVLVRLSCEDIKMAADLARKDYERAVKLHNSGSLPDEVFDQRRFKNDDARLKVDWCTISAPSSGTVLDTYHEAGEMASPGTKLLTLGDLSEVWATIYVDQPMLSKLSLEMPVSGILPEVKNRTFSGRIIKINQEAEFTPKNVQTRDERTRLVYGVKVSFPNPDGIMKPGMTIEVKLP